MSSDISLNDTSFDIYLNSLGFFLSWMLVEFSLTYMFHHVWEKFFNFMVFTFLENALNLWIFTHIPVPQSKLTPGRIFWKSVSPKTKRVEETMFCFIKTQSENIKMAWNIYLFKLFYFCMICNFFKWDDFTVLRIISIK